MEISALVERRVSGDQFNGLAVHGTEKQEVVSVEERAVCPVRIPHAGLSYGRVGAGVNYLS